MKTKQESSFLSLLGFPDFTEAGRLQVIIELKVTGQHQGLTAQTRKSIQIEGSGGAGYTAEYFGLHGGKVDERHTAHISQPYFLSPRTASVA